MKVKSKPLLLAVDTTRTTLRYIESILGDSYYVSTAQSGMEALDAAKAELPDLIMMNVNMSGMNGFEVLEYLKEDEETKDIPVVLVVDEKNNEIELRGLQAGAMDFITMPFDPEIMKTRLGHVLELATMRHRLEDEIEKQQQKISNMSIQSMMTIAQTVDAKDRYAKGHSVRVALYSKAIAKAMGWSDEDIDNLYYTALLHDIGKIAIEDSILNKAGALTEEEFENVKRHIYVGAEIVKNTNFIPGVIDGVYYHHERYDGTGYVGIEGEKIPKTARIIAVADAYEAMNADRSFRRKYTKEKAMEELVINRGTQFDPEVVDVFMKLLEEGFELDESAVEKVLVESENEGEAGALLRQVFNESAKEAQNELEKDSLTGFLNRRYFEEKINNYMLKPKASGAFFMMDLDNFKAVNDTYGHAAGDNLILAFAEVLRKNVRERDYVCRIGGDEFAIFYPEMDREHVIRDRAENIIEMFKQEKIAMGYRNCSVSIGIMTKLPNNEYMDCNELYQAADKALYHVKNNGKDDYHFYSFMPHDEQASDLIQKPLDLKQLMHQIAERKYHQGAYSVEYDRFSYIYQFIARNVERSKQQVQIILFTMVSEDESNRNKLEDSLMLLETAIVRSLRRGDVTTQFSPTQQIVILMGTNPENGRLVAERIAQKYRDLAGKNALRVVYDLREVPMDEKKA